MSEQNHQEIPFSAFSLTVGTIVGILSRLLNLIIAIGVVSGTVWVMRQFVPFSLFEAAAISIGLWVMVILSAIYGKVENIRNLIDRDEWDDYDFYDDEEYAYPNEPITEKSEFPPDPKRGNVISLEQRISSKKPEKHTD